MPPQFVPSEGESVLIGRPQPYRAIAGSRSGIGARLDVEQMLAIGAQLARIEDHLRDCLRVRSGLSARRPVDQRVRPDALDERNEEASLDSDTESDHGTRPEHTRVERCGERRLMEAVEMQVGAL